MLKEIFAIAYWRTRYGLLRHVRLKLLSESHAHMIEVLRDVHAGRAEKWDLVDVIDFASQMQWLHGYRKEEAKK